MRLFLGTGLGLGAGREGRREEGQNGNQHGGQHGGQHGDQHGGPVGPAPPALLRPPALSGGGRIGAALALDPGDWRGAARLEVAWLRDGAPIAGAGGPLAGGPGSRGPGSGGPLPDPLAYLPVAADDRAALAAEVTARGAGGTARARTAPITIAQAPPLAVAPSQEFTYTQTAGPVTLDISPFFSGNALSFDVTGEGVSLDPATGLVNFDAEALRAGVTLRVVARNSGGEAEIGLTLAWRPAAVLPAALTPPAISGAASGTGRVGSPLVADPGDWSGAPAITLQWLRDGAPIPGAAGVEFVPGDAEDGARIAVRATAVNVAGTAQAESAAILVAQEPPAVVGAIADSLLPVTEGGAEIAAAPAFAGRGLRFAVSGGGATIDAATGAITIPTGTARGPETVTVTATNSGGAAETAFQLRVLAAPAALAAPAPVVLARGEGSAAIEGAAWFAGEDLAFALEAAPAGTTLDAATGRIALPLAADLAGEIAVRATNLAGSAVQRLALRVLAAPVAQTAPAPVVFLQGATGATLSTQAYFSGPELSFVLEAGPAGATIQAGSGLVALSTATAYAGEIRVRARNPVGSAVLRLAVEVAATASDFADPAEVARLPFLYASAAPAWSAVTGAGRLKSAVTDRAHGDWRLARGDGRYRALARWSKGGATMTQARPFGLIGRMRKDGENFFGLQIYALLAANDRRQLQIRGYTGAGLNGTILATADAPWDWDAWTWLEAEFDGGRVRARIYPQAAVAPAWQVSITGAYARPGAFGPSSQGLNGTSPVVELRRLEYHPLETAAPAAAQGAEWSLGQTMVQS